MTYLAFSELRAATYCPRKCYYDRTRDDVDLAPPPSVLDRRRLAHEYETLLSENRSKLSRRPIDVDAEVYLETLHATRSRLERKGRWRTICNPDDTDVLVTGRECRGVVHKVLGNPIEPALVSAGAPPKNGIWEPQMVHAVAAAKALAWEYQTPVERAWVEYPAYGVIRQIDIGTQRKARYRRALRTVRSLDGPPPRTTNRSKCDACEYASECGVRTRTLRSLLGFD